MPSSPSRCLRVALVEAAVEVAGQVQHVRGRQVLVQRRVLSDERDAVQRGRRTGGVPPSTVTLARGRRCQADRQVQQGGLSGAVRADQRGHVPGGDRQRAVAQRSRRAVALAQAAGLDDVHATPSVLACAAPRRSAVSAAALTKIPQRARDERRDPVLVQPGRVGGRQPGDERAAERRRARAARPG